MEVNTELENMTYSLLKLKLEGLMNKVTIGKKLRQIRRERDITQKQLANKLNVTGSFICKYEKGDILPSIKTFIGLSKVLKISLDELILDKAPSNGGINDPELLKRFREVQHLPEEKKLLVKTYLDGLLISK